MRAILLAGGVGARLKPYTTVIPKPLMPVGEMPIMEIILRQLASHGFERVTVTLGYLGKLIKSYFGNGENLGIEIDYSHEEKPLGTMGPITLIRDLPEHFLVMNGDVLTDLPFSDFFKMHVSQNQFFSVATFQREISSEFGVIDVNPDGQLIGFREKPKVPFRVSMGVYMSSRRVIEQIPKNQPFGFDQLMLKLLAEGTSPFIYQHKGFWLDIGRSEDYILAQEEFEKNKSRFLFIP